MKNKRFLNTPKMQDLLFFSNAKERDKGTEFTRTSFAVFLVPSCLSDYWTMFFIVGTLKFLNW